MNAILLLFLVGVLLLAFEVVVPGAILGILGALAMVTGCVLAFVYHGATGGAIAVGAALLLVGLMLVIEFGLLPRTRWGRRLFLNKSIDSQSQPPVASGGIAGSKGAADTTLAPTGYVLIDGRRYEAVSRSGLIQKGEPVTVVGTSTFQLVVEKNADASEPLNPESEILNSKSEISPLRPIVLPGLAADNDLNKPVEIITAPVYLPPVPPSDKPGAPNP